MVVTIDGIPVYQALVSDADTGMLKISLVDDPAVQSNFQAFSNKKPQMYAVEDEAKRLVLGVVMRADFPIYRRDESMGEYYIIYSADTIRTMAEKYLVEGRQNNVNLMHQEGSDVSGVDMVQYFIKDSAKGVCPAGFEDIADGSLFAEFHIVNDEVWDAIADGTYKGFSLEGIFDLVPERNSDKVQDIVDTLNGLFSRIFKPQKYEKMTKVKGLLARLARALVEMGNVTTDKGILSWDGEQDLKAGDLVYVEDQEGNRTPAADGDYTTGEGKVIVVVSGKVSEIKDPDTDVDSQGPAPATTAAEEAKTINTDKGALSYEGELAAGVAVTINGEPAPDGEYTAEDGRIIVVAGGVITEIKDAAPVQEPTAASQEPVTIPSQFQRVAEAFQETYDEKLQKLYDAIVSLGFNYPWLVEAGEEFVIASVWSENGGEVYYRFNIVEWTEEGFPVLENGIKVVPAFVTPEEKEATEEAFQAVVREKETLAAQVSDLTAQVEALKAVPQGQPAHEEFQAGALPTTGNKKIDHLARIMGAK